jgi:hypothetical protein
VQEPDKRPVAWDSQVTCDTRTINTRTTKPKLRTNRTNSHKPSPKQKDYTTKSTLNLRKRPAKATLELTDLGNKILSQILASTELDEDSYDSFVNWCIGIRLHHSARTMAAVGPPSLFSQLYGDATKWENPDPSYTTLADSYGSGAGAVDGPSCRDGLVQLTTRSPVAVAFVSEAECDYVYVAHSLTIFPADITSTTVMDGLAIGFVGDRLNSATPVAFGVDFFARTANRRAPDIATIIGLTGHGATPPVFRSGPHAAPAADVRSRRAMILPCAVAARAIAGSADDGRYSLVGFYNEFLAGPLASADAAVVAEITPLADWWRLASTNVAAGTSVVSYALTGIATIRDQARLAAWANRVKDAQMARLGVGGPGLSNAAFAHGVAELRTTLEDTHLATLAFEREKNEKTFTDTHGPALADTLQRLTGVHRDEDLPPIHLMLLKVGKGRVYGMLQSVLNERAEASPVPLTAATAPVATTKLVDEVFRSYMPGDDGSTFGKGLSPFAVVCRGQEGIKVILEQVRQAQMIEGGTSVTLTDANALIAGDVRFPTQPFVAVEKLYGWSIIVDVFHGVAHGISISLRAAVVALGPQLQRMAAQSGDDQGAGMELICRVIFDMQQDYFGWLSKTAAGIGWPIPTFQEVILKVTSYRADSLSTLPAHWYFLADCPRAHSIKKLTSTPASAPAALRTASSAATVVNAHAERRLVSRYKDSGHASITAMVGGRQLDFPKQGGKAVCMTWALRGACNPTCKRKDMHVRYNGETNTALHAFMDECGVANAQP